MKKSVTEEIYIQGPAGALEGLLSYTNDKGLYVAVVCHPHPLYGGTMQNKVVHYTARSLNEVGVPTLRFNFRGVGASDGHFDDAHGEADDLAACARWMSIRYPNRQIILAGFSFGSYVAASMAADLDAAALILIAPAVQLYDFVALGSPACPWLVVQGDEDEVVPSDQVRKWAVSRKPMITLSWMEGAGHFFHGRLLDLSSAIKIWLKNSIDLG